MPNGYCDAMWVFTKILKPAFATLRNGFESVRYVDDSFLIEDTYDECENNAYVNGYVTESWVCDTPKIRIKSMGQGLFTRPRITIHMMASFIGNLTASFEAVPFGRLC